MKIILEHMDYVPGENFSASVTIPAGRLRKHGVLLDGNGISNTYEFLSKNKCRLEVASHNIAKMIMEYMSGVRIRESIDIKLDKKKKGKKVLKIVLLFLMF